MAGTPLSKYNAPTARMLFGKADRLLAALQPWIPAIAVAVVFGIAVAFAHAHTSGAFNSPDDASNFATARALVEEGRPWLEIPGGVEDEHDMLHPRAFTSVEGRAVPIQQLATPVSHAIVWALSGSYAVSTGLFAAVGFVGWVAALSVVRGLRPNMAIAAVIIAMPILFWLTRQYFSVSTYLLVMPWMITAAYLSWRRGSWPLAIAAGVLHGLALSARPDFLFAHASVVPLLVALVWAGRMPMPRVAVIAAFLGGTFVMAGAAILGTNTWLIGSPLSFGYDLARENPGFDQPFEAGTGIGPIDSLFARALPFGFPELDTVGRMLARYTLQMSPIFTVLAGWGVVLALRGLGRGRALSITGGILLVVIYVAISRTSLNLQGSTSPNPLPSHSLVRYFLPISLLMAFLAAGPLAQYVQQSARPLVRGLVITAIVAGSVLSTWQALFAFDGVSMVPWSRNLAEREATFTRLFQEHTPEDGIIVSPTYDKFAIAARRNSLTWQTVGENFGFRPREVAETIARQVEVGTPVYVWDTAEVGEEFVRELCDHELWLEVLQPRLYEVVENSSCGALIEEIFPDT